MYQRSSHRHRGTAGLVSFTLTALALAIASERLQAAGQTEHVDVVGQAASISQALKEQRASDSN